MSVSRPRGSCFSSGAGDVWNGNALESIALPSSLSTSVDSWSEYADGKIEFIARACGFLRFGIGVDPETRRRTVDPRHFVLVFPRRDVGRCKHHSALFSLRTVREEEIARDPNIQGAVANHLRFKSPEERRRIVGADEYIEFQLLSNVHEIPSQQPLRISMGPVRADKRGKKEFMRVDMGQCVQKIATDVLEDTKSNRRLVQNRWWMCIETLRLLCNVDRIDCSALDKPGVPPQEWVIRLIDAQAPINEREECQDLTEHRNIDDLMDFIDNGSGVAKPLRPARQRKKKGRDKDVVEGFAVPAESAVGCASLPSETRSGPDCRQGVRGPADSKGPTQTAVVQPASQFGAASEQLPGNGSAVAIAEPVGSAVTPQAAEREASGCEVPSHLAVKASFEDAADSDLMAELLSRYTRLQERSGRAEVESKVAVVRELLEVLDELERADAEIQEVSAASRVIFSAARKFEAKLRSMGFVRVEALGKPFNKKFHRVVGPPSEGDDFQVVVEELESGWVLGKDVVRPALVSLG